MAYGSYSKKSDAFGNTRVQKATCYSALIPELIVQRRRSALYREYLIAGLRGTQRVSLI